MEKDLEQIANMLILNGTLTECPGLIHGKMGIAVFFFHYAQFTGNELFADYAMDVIGEMLNQIHVNSPADYEKGIAGIGVGIDYLIQNNFLDVEDDICEDFDDRMYRAVMYDPWQDFSKYDGVTGYGQYWMTRVGYQTPSVKARECLLHIRTLIEEKIPEISISEQTDVYSFMYNLKRIPGFHTYSGLLEKSKNPPQNQTNIATKQITQLDTEKSPTSTGLLNGYAGEGMLRLTALGYTNTSWMHLL